MKVLIFKVNENPFCLDIPDFEYIIKGQLEVIPLKVLDYKIICNKNAKFNKLPPNRYVTHLQQILFGDFIITKTDKNSPEEFISLTDFDLQLLFKYFVDNFMKYNAKKYGNPYEKHSNLIHFPKK